MRSDLVTYDRIAPEDVIPAIEDAEAVFTSKVKFTKAVIDAAPKLKFIGVTATGYDNIDLAAAKARGIAVCNVPAYSTESVAQHTFALILELTNHVGRYTALVREHQWENAPDFTFIDRPLLQLSGRSLGIIGYGSIGRRADRGGFRHDRPHLQQRAGGSCTIRYAYPALPCHPG